MEGLKLKLISAIEYKNQIVDLLHQLNQKMNKEHIEKMLIAMTKLPNYKCFALFENNLIIGVCSGWTTVRIYCGKQLELDNVIIDSKIQSKGYGKYLMNAIKEWSISNDYQSISLNTYIENSRSHKFYFNQGFKILGFHFENRLSM